MKTRIVSAILIILSITACNATIEIGLEHSPTVTVAASPLSTVTSSLFPTEPAATASPTSLPPTPTTPLPTVTPQPTDAPLPHTVQIFLIAMEDNGQSGVPVGCGDSAVPVHVEITPTQAVLKAALTALLSVKSQYYGQSGLYNALYQSNLQVDSLSIQNGKASVYLTGTLSMGGECDIPRVQAQLEQTVLQFPTVMQADIYINGKSLEDVLSLKG
jgi:hypothetical protein